MAQRLAYGNALKSHDDLVDALWFRGLPPVHASAQGGYAIVFPSDLATESPLHKRRVGDAERLSEGGCRPAGGPPEGHWGPLEIARFGQFLAGYIASGSFWVIFNIAYLSIA